MSKNILIIGQGSAGNNHFKILNSFFKKKNIKIVSSRKLNFFKNKKLKNEIISFMPKNIILCAPSSEHYKYMNVIENLFFGIDVLIEKPLFNKFYKLKKNYNNNYFIGYNLRFHPVTNFIKKFIKKKKIIFVSINSYSYLPNWRINKDYSKSVSAQKNLGGGVLLELSHEIDLLNWIFNKVRFVNVFNKKISKLRVDCDDILSAQGYIKNNAYFNLNLNFFSKITERKIRIDSDKYSIVGDYLENRINIFQKKNKIIDFKNFNIKQSYINQYKDFFKSKKIICSLKNAVKTQKLLKEISEKR